MVHQFARMWHCRFLRTKEPHDKDCAPRGLFPPSSSSSSSSPSSSSSSTPGAFCFSRQPLSVGVQRPKSLPLFKKKKKQQGRTGHGCSICSTCTAVRTPRQIPPPPTVGSC